MQKEKTTTIVASEEWISENTLPDGMAMQNRKKTA